MAAIWFHWLMGAAWGIRGTSPTWPLVTCDAIQTAGLGRVVMLSCDSMLTSLARASALLIWLNLKKCRRMLSVNEVSSIYLWKLLFFNNSVFVGSFVNFWCEFWNRKIWVQIILVLRARCRSSYVCYNLSRCEKYSRYLSEIMRQIMWAPFKTKT